MPRRCATRAAPRPRIIAKPPPPSSRSAAGVQRALSVLSAPAPDLPRGGRARARLRRSRRHPRPRDLPSRRQCRALWPRQCAAAAGRELSRSGGADLSRHRCRPLSRAPARRWRLYGDRRLRRYRASPRHVDAIGVRIANPLATRTIRPAAPSPRHRRRHARAQPHPGRRPPRRPLPPRRPALAGFHPPRHHARAARGRAAKRRPRGFGRALGGILEREVERGADGAREIAFDLAGCASSPRPTAAAKALRASISRLPTPPRSSPQPGAAAAPSPPIRSRSAARGLRLVAG